VPWATAEPESANQKKAEYTPETQREHNWEVHKFVKAGAVPDYFGRIEVERTYK
jgi:hypothetical protein